MPTNKDLIRMHLEEFIQEHPHQSWYTLMGYCLGYYNVIDRDIMDVIFDLQCEGKIR